MLDLEAEGQDISLEEIDNIHLNKTGALIAFSATAGATIGSVDQLSFERIEQFASLLGLLFQVTDDLLDVTRTTHELGKTAGKDAVSGKATYPSTIGLDATRAFAQTTHSKAQAAIAEISQDTSLLRSIGQFLLERES